MKMTEYQAGVPCWVDLSTKDLEGAKAFYAGLFGWTAEASEDPAAGGYTMFLLDGQAVAGGNGLMAPEQPTVWTTYVSVEDADKTAEAVAVGGGSVLVAPMDVLDVGRMGLFADPAGAVIAAWQPRAHKGAAVVDEPGSLSWNELLTRDVEGAKVFYPAVFGWGYKASDVPDVRYTEWQVGDRTVGGLMGMDENFPPDLPPHWMAYFAVADCAASVAKVSELGGTVMVPPTTIPVGTFAVCADPQGASFGLIELSPEMARAAKAG